MPLKTSQLTPTTDIANEDLIQIVDVSDTITMGASTGTNKKVTALTLANKLSSIGNYAASSHTHSNATTTAAGFMSSTDKSKLDNIASDAEVNVQANWNETTTTSDAFIQNKPGLATTSLSGFMSSTDKSKLDGLSNYTHPTGDGNLHVPATGTNNNGKVLTAGATAGSLSWTTPTASVSLDSPQFTGTPTAPTAQTGTNTTQIATTQFVQNAVAGITNTGSPTYLITSNIPTVAEGTAVTFTVTTTDSTVTQLYWTTASTDVTPVNGTINLNGNTGTFTTTAIADSTSEGVDTFTVQIRTGSTTGTIVGTCSVNISDNPVVYTLTPDKTTVVEGQSVTFNIIATNTPGTLLYWIATDGADQLVTTQGVVPITSNVGSFSTTVKNDSIAETGSYFTVKLRLNNVNGPDIGSATINISDISVSNTVWIADTPDTSNPFDFQSNPYAFDVNANGNWLAVVGGNPSKVTIYELTNANSWNKVGEFSTSAVTGNSSRFTSISMNAAGDRVVLGSSVSGVVAVCEYNGSNWNLKGSVIVRGSNEFGRSVSINDIGDRIIIGGSGSISGTSWLYIWDGVSWVIFPNLQNEFTARPFVDINATGDIFVTVTTLGDGTIHRHEGSFWSFTSTPTEENDRVSSNSRSVSINAAGNIVAIGHSNADSNGINNRGKVTIYKRANSTQTSSWVKMGQDIFGEAENEYSGFSVSLNAAGDRVAIGATGSDDFGTDHGRVRVYAYDGVNWNQVGADIGNTNYTNTGWAVRLNSTGNRVYTHGLNEISLGNNIFSYKQQ